MNPIFLIDFYKVGHVSDYPTDISKVWCNWTPRSSRVPHQNKVVFFGLRYFILEILKKEFNENFFDIPLDKVLREYREVMKATLGIEDVRTDHIAALWNLQYLPLEIYAIPEGFSTPLGCPAMVMCNTVPEMFWLPNYMETILSNILWKACTSATTAQAFRRLFIKHAKDAGETDFSFVDWQGHDFSFRGMAGREDAILSGMAHLLSFSGTDTIPAILALREYYDAPLNCGGSVAATEHSVMCAGGQDGELETFRHLIEDVHPNGIVSIVSDTWDLWKVLTEYVPALKDKILARNGKVVIRPDSGDPVNIICGYKYPQETSPASMGTLRLLASAMGTDSNRQGLPLINKMGAIYGDSINLQRADEILYRIIHDLKLSPYNMVFGIGSYTYEYVTRDTYGFAIKATAIERDGQVIDIFKKPVTDDGTKNSHKGIPIVYKTEESSDDQPEFYCKQGGTPEMLDNCAFTKVFRDGLLFLAGSSAGDIRKRVRA